MTLKNDVSMENIALLFDVKLTSLAVGNLTSDASDFARGGVGVRVSGRKSRKSGRCVLKLSLLSLRGKSLKS